MPGRRIHILLLSALLGLLLFTAAAAAEDDVSAVDGTRLAKSVRASEGAKEASPAASGAPVLQTRHTVKQRIESIEPSAWLQRFGQVRVVAKRSER